MCGTNWMIACLVSSVLAATPALAGMDFGNTAAIAPGPAAVDGDAEDSSPAVATDENGVWIAAWTSEDTAVGVVPPKRTSIFSRSTDDGATWSTPALVVPGTGNIFGQHPTVATDTLGTWVMAWDDLSNVVATVSADDGATWSALTTIFDGATDSSDVTIETDRAGVWVVAFTSDDSLGGTIGTDQDILFSRSVDNGATWSPAAPLNSNAAVDASDDRSPAITTDRAGTWIAVWGGLFGTRSARSTDNGTTWEPLIQLGATTRVGGTDPDIATDGNGRWVVTWSGGQSLSKVDIWFSRSDDDGLTWTAETPLHSYMATDRGTDLLPSVAVLDGGLWVTVWGSSDDLRGARGDGLDMTVSYSRDAGASWSSPSGLTTKPRKNLDDIELRQAIASSPTGRTVVVWESDDALGETIGNDTDTLFAVSSRDCPLTARMDCLHSTSAFGSSLKIKDNAGGRDLLAWRLGNLEETLEADLGDPVTSDSLVLCLYEKVSGAEGLIGEWDARAGGTCSGRPCWTQAAGQVSLSDGKLDRGSVKKLSLRAGPAGSGSLRAKLMGAALAPPLLPLDATSPVRIQLINLGTNTCWEGVHNQAKTNDDRQFSSRSE